GTQLCQSSSSVHELHGVYKLRSFILGSSSHLFGRNLGNRFLSMHMVTRFMHHVRRHTLIVWRKKKKVPVGAWRNIDNFLVTNNGGSYKTTNHQYKIVFIPTTDITPSTLQEEKMFLSLVDFESIQSGKLDTTNLIDVIGQVFELGDLETVQCHVIKRYLTAFGESLLKQYTVSANNLKKKLLYA
ncbi:unnamed protein product, partial [Brassica napus]